MFPLWLHLCFYKEDGIIHKRLTVHGTSLERFERSTSLDTGQTPVTEVQPPSPSLRPSERGSAAHGIPNV